jgi:hypothetical protein
MYWQRHHAGKTRDPKRFVHQSLQAFSSTLAAAGESYRLKIEGLDAASRSFLNYDVLLKLAPVFHSVSTFIDLRDARRPSATSAKTTF